MQWITTSAYTTLLSRLILAEPGLPALAPARLAVGNGGHNNATGQPIPAQRSNTALAAPITDVALTSVLRDGATITVLGIIPGGAQPLLISEVGITTASGLLIARATFAPQTITEGVDAQFTLELFPEA